MNLAILKNKNYALFLIAQSISNLGSNLQQFALSLYLLSITHSATLFASMMAIALLPRILFSPIAGVFGDWFDRKRMIIGLDLLNALVMGFFALVFITTGSLSVPVLFAIVIYLEITEIFYASSMSAVVPSLLAKEDLYHANTLKTVINSLINVVAPLLASLLFGYLGILVILVLNAVSFLIAGLAEVLIHIPKTNKLPKKIDLKQFNKDFLEGLAIIKNNQGIKDIIGLGMILNFCLNPLFSVGLMIVAKKSLGMTNDQFGLFISIFSASMLVGPIVLGNWAAKQPAGKLTNTVFLTMSILVGLLAIVPHTVFLTAFSSNTVPFIVMLIICFFIGCIASVVNIAIGTLFQTIVPREFMGRTSSTMNMLLMAAMPLGQMIMGLALDILSPALVILVTALVILAAVLFYWKRLSQLDQNIGKDVA